MTDDGGLMEDKVKKIYHHSIKILEQVGIRSIMLLSAAVLGNLSAVTAALSYMSRMEDPGIQP